MKIIQSIASLKKENGGTTFFVTDLSLALTELGEEVSLITKFNQKYTSKKNLYLPPESMVNSILVKEKYQGLFLDFFDNSYRNAVRQELKKATVIHITGLWNLTSHQAIVESKKLEIPIIISPQGMLEPWAIKQRFWKKKLAWLLYQNWDLKSAKVIHATAEQEAENLRRLGLRQPIAIIPNCINFENLKTVTSKNYLNLSTNPKNVNKIRKLLFLSRIHPKKGLIELVRAWSKIHPKNWKVVVAGPSEGDHRAEVELFIKKKKLTKYFEFVGSVEGEEKNKLYQTADLFILPTFSENFGIVVAEALASGVPVITTKAAPWQGIEKFKCGWWIDVGEEPLKFALEEALHSSPEKLSEMGERGKIYAENTFGSIMVAKQMLEVYRWMLGEVKKPDYII